VIREDARFGIGEVSEDSFHSRVLRHEDRLGLKSVSFHRRLDEQPFGRADPLVAASDLIEKSFEFGVVDPAIGILQDANGKATERLIRQVTLKCCEASRVSWKLNPSTRSGGSFVPIEHRQESLSTRWRYSRTFLRVAFTSLSGGALCGEVHLSDKYFAFVLMPFGPEFDDTYKLGIKEVASALSVVAERVDEQSFSETILERIYRQIEAADFIIADMTGRNPNVFYEVGYAHAKKKPVILITKEAGDIPFDLKHHRHLIYGDKITDLREKLEGDIRWIKSEIEKSRAVPITVSNRPLTGDLTKTKWAHTGEVTFKLDLTNSTDIKSPDIEAIYLHTGPGWTFKQGSSDCPSTKSEIGAYTLRHFIQPSVPRLSPGAWSQIKVVGSKAVWVSWKGEEPQDQYRLTGRALLDIATSEGSYLQELDLEITLEEIPF